MDTTDVQSPPKPLTTWLSVFDKKVSRRLMRSPVEFEVWREDQFSRMVHGPPHQAQHQDLQPAALEQVDLVG